MPADAKGVASYGIDRIRFLSPVPAGEGVACAFRLLSVEEKGQGRHLLRLAAEARIDGSDESVIAGEILALVIGWGEKNGQACRKRRRLGEVDDPTPRLRVDPADELLVALA